MEQNAAVLDIGSSKVVCMIGGSSEDNRLAVYGVGITEYDGFKKEKFLSETGLADAVNASINAAQNEAKRKIRKLVVGVPGEFTLCKVRQAQVKVSAKDGCVSEADVERLIDESMRFPHPEGYSIIHSTPLRFEADGAAHATLPLDVKAQVIGAEVSHIFASNEFVAAVNAAVAAQGIKLELLVAQPLAVGLFLAPAPTRQSPVIVVDMGYWNTDISILVGNALAYHRSLRLGGAHFTSDIAYGFGVPTAVAEPIKRRYVFGLAYAGGKENVRMPDGSYEDIEQETVQYIIEERAKEFAALLLRILEESGERLDSAPLYSTGGGFSMMRGSSDFLQSMTERSVNPESPWVPRLGSPNYVSCYAVLDFIIHNMRGKAKGGSVFKALVNFFSK